MATCLMLIGLPGSGKTHRLPKLIEDMGDEGEWVIYDDPTSTENIITDNSKNIAVCDPHFCNPIIREKAIHIFIDAGFTVKCTFFENNPEKCYNNIKHRNDNRIISEEGLKSFMYEIPEGIKPLTIWQP